MKIRCEYCGLYGHLGRCEGCGAPNQPSRHVEVGMLYGPPAGTIRPTMASSVVGFSVSSIVPCNSFVMYDGRPDWPRMRRGR
jgi:hypothetical protein